ncbi:Protein of unknown function [Arsukibacterium tuosuense]|uniref:DUF2975 domain-containing protein n=1 Tax=Arsukibacterium tuosuense TaxID=1323745 RepID=A0A285IAB0_9GAMM|nr:DUF2975 domain-containing protein [Arsukibacterium tuosuense]SNY44898.1 Protein of unknown function [Arsukibacterium tuosuense]
MTANTLYRLTHLSLAITLILTLITAIIALALPFFDEHLLSQWQIELANSAGPNEAELTANEWWIVKNQGMLTMQTSGVGLAISRAVTILLVGGLISYALYGLRGFFAGLRSERPFQASTPALLKKVGYSFIALAIVLYLEVPARFYLFIPDAADIADYYGTHIKVSPPAAEAFFIIPTLHWGLIVAGIFLLAIARAFALGLSLQTENDEII